jgi:glycosyltransferase involved in cell wall biosynthesis
VSGGLRIVHALSPAPFGGLERVVLDLSAAQRRAGHDVLLFAAAAADHPFVAAARSRGLPLEIVSGSSRGYLREARILRALLRRESPDVVHTHGYRSDVAHGLPVRGLAAVTTTLHGFTSGEWSGWRARVYERIQVVAARWCDAAIAVSDGVAERLRDAGVAPDRIHIVRNAWTGGTAFLDRMEARARLGAPARAPLIGWIGRVSPEKGPDLLLDAMRPLGPTARGVVIGDGPLRAPLEAASRAALGDRVTWCGAVRRGRPEFAHRGDADGAAGGDGGRRAGGGLRRGRHPGGRVRPGGVPRAARRRGGPRAGDRRGTGR